MKYFYCSFLALLLSFSATADGENKTGFLLGKSESGFALGPTKKDKPIISNGFYLALNLGFPSVSGSSLGTQFGLNLGNQWMFVKNETWGLGMNITWFRFGFSSYSIGTTTVVNLGLNFLEFGPMFSYALSEKMAFDAYVNIHPASMYLGISSGTNSVSGYTASSFFTRFTPGVRFRYNKFMVGFEPTVGAVKYSYANSNNSYSYANYTTASVFAPTFLLGFKF